ASILAAYTWAKLISDTDTITGWPESGGTGGIQDYNNLRGEKSLASFDVPQRLVVSYIMDVPVGRGRKYLSTSNGFVNAALGGWVSAVLLLCKAASRCISARTRTRPILMAADPGRMS